MKNIFIVNDGIEASVQNEYDLYDDINEVGHTVTDICIEVDAIKISDAIHNSISNRLAELTGLSKQKGTNKFKD